jgi:uncharacterized protein YndB with AHSA1/START domain
MSAVTYRWVTSAHNFAGGVAATRVVCATLVAQQHKERTTARNHCFIDAPPEAVFAVLSDPASYDRWVVGAKEVRDADASWPARGSRLHHTIGAGPIGLDDSTSVLASDAPRHLRLRARGRPLGIALVDFELAPERGGTRVQLREWIADPWFVAAFNLILDPLIRVRNAETLRRLNDVVTSS